MLTAGTTGLGAVDPIAEALALRDRYGCRLHVDAVYGGFFTLLAWDEDGAKLLGPEHGGPAAGGGGGRLGRGRPAQARSEPYGCGAVLFRDPTVGALYRHDSPYTYFTSNELHLGEISLECSRAGAAAGALWLTLRALPLEAGAGLGPVVAGGLRAARAWAELFDTSDEFRLYQPPELDILAFWPRPGSPSCAAVDAASAALLQAAMADPSPVYLSTLRLDAARLRHRDPALAPDTAEARVLRSVLMKPEHEGYVDTLHRELVRISGDQAAG